jgi:TRAP-type C4-dicarboxylate transport system permease small subunit
MTLADRSQRLAQALAVLGGCTLLLLAIGTGIDVVLRYGFARPIRGFVDVSALAGAVALAACMPWVVANRGHIAVDFLGKALGPRAHRRLDDFGALVTASFFALMAWQYIRFALELRSTGETTAVLRWPVWPWWAAVALFIALAAMIGLATLRTPVPADRGPA